MPRLREWTPSGRLVLGLFVATQAVYLAMVLVTLPHLRGLAGGNDPFDLMPTGYDLPYAQYFLDAIGAEGRTYYLWRQIPLDLVYPALFGIGYGALWLWLVARAGLAPVLRFFALLAPLAGAADYLENGLIGLMLCRFPDLTSNLVSAANAATLLKSWTTIIFLFGLPLPLAVIAYRWTRRRFR